MSTASKYQKESKLGEGAFGTVYKAKNKLTLETVALKRMNPVPQDEGIPASTIREIAILRSLKHPNIVYLVDVLFAPPKLTLIFEYCERDLKRFVEESYANSRSLTEAQIRNLMRQLLTGLCYLHERNIVHRDIKPPNLLIKDGVLKITDFGLARIEKIPVKKYAHEAVTLWYRSPDFILGSANYGLALDIWSSGCVLAELAQGHPLFAARNDPDQLAKICSVLGTPTSETFPSFPRMPNKVQIFDEHQQQLTYMPPQDLRTQFDAEAQKRLGNNGFDLLSRMLKFEPAHRITAAEALQHPYFQGPEEPVVVPPDVLTENLPLRSSVEKDDHSDSEDT